MSQMFEKVILELCAIEEELEQAWKAGSEEEIEASEEIAKSALTLNKKGDG